MPTMKEALAAKITSKEQFDQALVAVSSRNADYLGKPARMSDDGRTKIANKKDYERVTSFRGHEGYSAADTVQLTGQLEAVYAGPMTKLQGEATHKYDYTRWWLLREHMRMVWGVYDRADALKQIHYRFPELAVHCRADEEDPAVVFYTPDAQAGERDAQVRTTLGRLVRKLYPQVTDEDIRNLEAAHRADRSDEVEFLTGDALVAGYENGVGSCMGKPRAAWDRIGGRHPTEAFCAEGFALAVGRDGSGHINSRTITWVNPADQNDKRWLRLYGDTALIKRLEKRGYRNAGLNGARLKRIDLSMSRDYGDATSHVRVLMPYLDAPSADAKKPEYGQYVVLDGDQHLLVVGDKHPVFKALQARKVGIPAGQVTAGYLMVSKKASTDELQETCPISGEKFDATLAKVFVWIDGKARGVHPNHVAKVDQDYPKVAHLYHGCKQQVRCKADAPTFSIDYDTWVDEPKTRSAFGFNEMSEKFYSGADRWYRGGYRVTAHGLIKSEDAVMVVRANDPTDHGWTHVSEVEGNKENWTKTHRVDASHALYVEKGVETVKTVSGRTVVPTIHEVRKRFDGQWDFTRNMREEYHFGVSIWLSRDEPRMTDDQIVAATTEELVRQAKGYGRSAARGNFIRQNLSNDEVLAIEKAAQFGSLVVGNIFGTLPVSRDDRTVFESCPTWRSRAGADLGWRDLINRFVAFAQPIVDGTTTMPELLRQGEVDRPLVHLKLCLACWKAFDAEFDAAIAELRTAPAQTIAANTVRFVIAA